MYSDHCANPPQLSCKCHIVEVHRNLQNDKVQTDFNAVRVDFHGVEEILIFFLQKLIYMFWQILKCQKISIFKFDVI